jgi:hypothetical protein
MDSTRFSTDFKFSHKKMKALLLIELTGVMCLASLLGFAASAIGDDSEPIAAKYPGDRGIGQDARVVFADDFEQWESGSDRPPAKTWDAVRNDKNPDQQQTRIVPGRVVIGSHEQSGKNVLRLACHSGGPNAAGLRKHLGNYSSASKGLGAGYEEIYVRYYQKLDEGYTPERNHGANLGGRDLSRPGSWWAGMANTTDVASHGYFYSGLQPYTGNDQNLYWGFYSYHLDKPTAWGDDYKPAASERKPIEIGRWYCLERRLKLNSVDPLKSDGLEELWVDGELALRREGLRFRKVPELRITVFELEVYYHGLPKKFTPESPIKVDFDHVVVAKEPIGCLRSE